VKKSIALLLAAILFAGMTPSARAGLLEDLAHRLIGDDNTSTPQKPSHLAGAPIPSGTGAVTCEHFNQIDRAWYTRSMLDAYNKAAKPDPKVAAYIGETIARWSDADGAPSQEVLLQHGTEIEKLGVTDPLFLTIAGLAQLDHSRMMPYFEQAVAGFPQSAYPKFLQYTASAYLGKLMHDAHADTATQEARDQASLAFLRTSMEDADFTPAEMPVLRMRLLRDSGRDLFSRHPAEMCAILESSPHVEPWVADYFQGLRFIDEAWKARGSGYADTVTDQGWKDFAKNIGFARERLTKSWELNPKDPAAATSMITVTMAESEETDTMRKWFDRAVAAQMDYEPVYDKLLYGLYPRWLGSHEEMLRFANECMQTGRYDTYVPYQYVRAVRDIAGDSDDKDAIFRQPEINKNLQTVIAGYISVGKTEERLRFYHTLAAIIAYKGGNMDDAKKHLDAIHGQTDTSKNLAGFEDIPAMLQKLSAPKQ